MTADRIKALRESRGWTQAELARRMNMTRNGINSWEQGLSMPSPQSLVDLARLFSVSTDYLLGVEKHKGCRTDCAARRTPAECSEKQ